MDTRLLEHLPATATPEQVTEILKRDGAVIVDNLLPAAEVDALLAELEPWMVATPYGPDDFSGRHTKRTGALVARSPKCRALIVHPLIRGATSQFLAHATSYQLHLTQVIAIGPGEPAQPIHRDQWAFDFFPFPKGFDVQCSTIWALTDFTEENGATRVIPGSNRFEDRMQFAEADSVPAEMTKGSVLIYSGSVYHGGGANRSDAERIGLNLTYCLSWLRQEENQYLAVPLEIAKTLPDDLLRLMGYARGAYALGYVGDLADPIAVVREGGAKLGLGEDLAAAQARLRAGYGAAAGE